jgi:GPH family glycoside/pentoside/hexuronide:cation symporter
MTRMALTTNSATADQQRPSLKIDISYATIALGSPILWSVVDSWLLYFYLPPSNQGDPRVPAALYGIAIFAVRALNALVTPPIGYLSDHTRTRWGRRIPFILTSALPLLVFFVLLWTPPVQGESMWNLIYLVVILAFYNLAYSFLTIPYSSLMPELALTERHRVRISTWCASFQLVGVILAGLAGMLIESKGFVIAAIICASVVLPLFYLPFLVLRERSDRQIAKTERLGFWQSITLTLRNRAFLTLALTGICYWSATTFLMGVIPYIVTEICLSNIGDTTYFYIPAVLVSLACYPVVMGLANRFGKWRVAAGSLLASAIVLPGLMLIGDWLPVPLIAQGIAWMALEAAAMSGVMVLTQAFTAEITDYDAELTGQRREGAYYSAWGVLDQVINGTAAAMLPILLLLGRSRADVHGPLGVRLVGVLGGALLLVAFLVFLRYPLRNRSVPG